MKYRIGVDIGGTFTDFVLLSDLGELAITKVPSNPKNIAGVILDGLSKLSKQSGIDPEILMQSIDLIVHGTTIATNAVIQHKLAKTGMIATAGFRDILELREGLKEKLYDYSYAPPKPLVPRQLRLGVSERVLNDGSVLTPLCEDDVRAAADIFKREGVEAVVIGLIWSIKNPVHEIMVRDIIEQEMPGVPVFMSSEVLSQIREYPRFSTAALCAALAPLLTNYLDTLEANIAQVGFDRALRYIQCNGGTTSSDLLKKRPVLALDSGPAAGPSAALFFSEQVGNRNVISLDMGGTSLDVSLVNDGKIETRRNVDVHRYRVGLPMVNVLTIGAGGGSIAHIDDAGILNVGPQSAESYPGPACYNRGGIAPTVTDANLALGYFSPDAVLGGSIKLNYSKSIDVLKKEIGDPLGVSAQAAAHSVFSIINENMANAVRSISSEKGHDIRDFTIVCGGGCSPAHAAAIAQSIGVKEVLVPRVSSVLCSFGAAITDVRHDYSSSLSALLKDCNIGDLRTAFEQMRAEAFRDLAREGFDPDRVEIEMDMELRYVGEIGELRLNVQTALNKEDWIGAITDSFHELHEAAYTFSDPQSDLEVMGLNLVAFGKRENTVTKVFTPDKQSAEDREAIWELPPRACWFSAETTIQTPIFAGKAAKHGQIVKGPAVIEEETTAILVPPGWQIELTDKHMWVLTDQSH